MLVVSEDAGGAETLLGMSNEENNVLGEEPQYTFRDLNNKINGNNDSVVYISGNYKFIDGDDIDYIDGIVISRNIVIDGQNQAVIDGSNLARVFYVAEGVTDFTLKNVKVQNAYAYDGSVVYLYNANDNFITRTMKNAVISGAFINHTAQHAVCSFWIYCQCIFKW